VKAARHKVNIQKSIAFVPNNIKVLNTDKSKNMFKICNLTTTKKIPREIKDSLN
jgi:hypothetical protein